MAVNKKVLPPTQESPAPNDARLRQGEQTKEIILETAAGLLLQRSASGMAMSELVSATGVPASSIYYHFGSKEGVISAVVETGVRRWLQQLPETRLRHGMSDAQMRNALSPIFTALTRDSLFLRLLLKVGLEFSETDNLCAGIVRRARADVVSYGVRIYAPLFGHMPPARAEQAARRVVRQVMAYADGIAIAVSIEKDRASASEMFDRLADFALAMIQVELHRPRA